MEGKRLDANAVNELMKALSPDCLKTLNLGHNKIDMKGIDAFCRLVTGDENESLKGEDKSLKSERMKVLSQMGRTASFIVPPSAKVALVSLSLQSTKLGDRAVVKLCSVLKLTRLSYLNLNDTNIGAGGTKALGRLLEGGGMKSLTTLLLSWNKISKAASAIFFDGISGSRVATLDLSYNPIGDAESKVAVDSLAAMLETNLFLTHLDLSNNQLDAADCEKLSDALALNDTLLALHLTDNKEEQGTGSNDILSYSSPRKQDYGPGT